MAMTWPAPRHSGATFHVWTVAMDRRTTAAGQPTHMQRDLSTTKFHRVEYLDRTLTVRHDPPLIYQPMQPAIGAAPPDAAP
jgi:hypothetical protein